MAMGNLIIRKAERKDLDTLLRFEQELINTERPFDPTIKTVPTRYYDLEEMIRAEHIELVVAEINDRVVGSGYARIEAAKPFLQHARYAYLGFMYVEPAFRGRSVNKVVLDYLIEWAATRGLKEVRLDVYFANEAAISAYEKAGFTKLVVEMRRETE